jgi:hypothetical protein
MNKVFEVFFDALLVLESFAMAFIKRSFAMLVAALAIMLTWNYAVLPLGTLPEVSYLQCLGVVAICWMTINTSFRKHEELSPQDYDMLKRLTSDEQALEAFDEEGRPILQIVENGDD